MDCKTALQRLPELPPSAQQVFCALLEDQPKTAQQLRGETGIPRRTLYTALQKLRDAQVLKEQTSLRDSRQTFFWIDHDKVDAAAAA